MVGGGGWVEKHDIISRKENLRGKCVSFFLVWHLYAWTILFIMYQVQWCVCLVTISSLGIEGSWRECLPFEARHFVQSKKLFIYCYCIHWSIYQYIKGLTERSGHQAVPKAPKHWVTKILFLKWPQINQCVITKLL